MIQAQGAGDVNPDPYKRVSSVMNPPTPYGYLRSGDFGELPSQDQMATGKGISSSGANYGSADNGLLPKEGPNDPLREKRSVLSDVILGSEEDPTAIRLGVEWVTGTGPKTRHLGENTRFVRAFRNSEGVSDARERLYQKYDGHLADGDSVVNYDFRFTIPRAMRARTPAEQFIGTYKLNLIVRGDRILFEARNTSSLESLSYGRVRGEIGAKPGWPNKDEGPGSNKHQILTWTEPVVQRWFPGGSAA